MCHRPVSLHRHGMQLIFNRRVLPIRQKRKFKRVSERETISVSRKILCDDKIVSQFST